MTSRVLLSSVAFVSFSGSVSDICWSDRRRPTEGRVRYYPALFGSIGEAASWFLCHQHGVNDPALKIVERRAQGVKLIRNVLVSASRSEEFAHDRERKNLTAAQFLERRERLLARRVKGPIEHPKKFSAGLCSSATRRWASAPPAL